MRYRNQLAVLMTATAMGLAASSAALALDNTVGADAYNVSCSVCHGADGKGGGEFADVLTVKPADLTKLSAKNDGVFPFLAVFQTIDGRATIRAHGPTIMPIWGNSFAAGIGETAGPFGTELLIRAKIVALVDYIETLQTE